MRTRQDRLLMMGFGLAWAVFWGVPTYFAGMHGGALWSLGSGIAFGSLPFLFPKNNSPAQVLKRTHPWAMPFASAICFLIALALTVAPMPLWLQFVNGVASMFALIFLIWSKVVRDYIQGKR